ncbi:uncharacterized protein LOC129773496 [Toxorhynchites rutilus septentrionalis]|uniref:uncharacterized protein LOC129773496 n=1 Tax=Toxorhynchites rutilus septentrionalis TaxID=329112 RepID=UPI002479F25B|nr:uncharacterized protein LOC129773496 [Toxorhynchites rutilus septentrionalis]
MFHQLQIIESDRQFERFLWRDSPDQPPQVYNMDVAIFGATCSPSSTQFIKNTNAKAFAERYPRAVGGIIKSHYVDDYLSSFETIEDAKVVAEDVKMIHSKGGFMILNWASNSRDVLDYLGEGSADGVKELNLTGNGKN